MTAWTLVAGSERTRIARAGLFSTWVERAGDGKRWCATFLGRPETGLDGARLLTWETAEGAMAHVERCARRRQFCEVCGTPLPNEHRAGCIVAWKAQR